MTTDDFIKKIAADAKPVKVIKPVLRWLGWMVLVVVSASVIAVLMGIRGDIALKIEEEMFMAEILLAVAVGMIASLSANWLCIPDCGQKKWVVWLPFVPLTLLATLVSYQIFVAPVHIMGQGQSIACAGDILFIAIMPAIALFILLRMAATTNRMLTSFMAVLAVLAFAYMTSRLICPNDSMGHIILWHYLPVVIMASIGAFIGKKLLKW